MRAAYFSFLQEFLQRRREFQNRFARLQIHHPDPVPIRRRMDAGAERLGERFLGRKALGEIGHRLPVGAETLELGLAQNAPGETLAEALEHLFDPLDLDDIRADAVDPRPASVISLFISRTASRIPT